jgi:hypothetical protein
LRIKIDISTVDVSGVVNDLTSFHQTLESSPVLHRILETIYNKITETDAENEEFRLVVENYLLFNASDPEQDATLFEEARQ